MKPNTRLMWCVVMILGSALYGLLVLQDPDIAEAVALGYVSLLLTIFFAVNAWKKP